MLEIDFNSSMRSTLRLHGLNALHIREAEVPGPSDLIVWKGDKIIVWAELKVDDEPLRPSQVEFMRARDNESGNAVVIRMMGNTGIITVERPLKPDGWSVDNRDLIVLYRTMRQTEFDWALMLTRLKRPRRN